jgi:hypothetical protein
MDLNEFGPAPGLPRRDDLAEAIKQMAREREPSTSRLAGSFSQPVAYNHDQLFQQAQQARQSARPPQMQPLQFREDRLGGRIAKAADNMTPQKPQQVRVKVEREQAQPQRQAPVFSPSGPTPVVTPHTKPATASTIPSRGPLGGQFPADKPGIDPFKEFDPTPQREVPDPIKEMPAWDVPLGKTTTGSVSATPYRGVLGGQFSRLADASEDIA